MFPLTGLEKIFIDNGDVHVERLLDLLGLALLFNLRVSKLSGACVI
jgi:hypothetical protein